MAAEYGININVRTQTQQLKRLQTQLKELENTAKSIKSQEIIPGIKGGSAELMRKFKDKVAALRNEVILTNNAFVNNTKQINNNAGEIRTFSRALRDARANVKLFSGEYNVLTQGIQKADFTARFKELKEFSRKAAITAGNLGGAIPMAQGTSFEDLMSFRPTQTRKAINEYLGFLRDLEARLDRTSDRFKQVTLRIREMEKELKQAVVPSTMYGAPIGPQPAPPAPPLLAGEGFFNRTLGRNRQFQQGGMFYEPGGFASRRRNALSSGLIGGGFPLLFGQGLGASVGGGLGGIAGGFLGGGLGFGLSIVGTQLGKQFDVLAQKARALGDALRKPTENLELLVQSLGRSNTPFSDTVQTLKDLGQEGPAASLALDAFNQRFGKGVSNIDDVGKEFIEFQNQLNTLGTALTILVAGPLAKFIEGINKVLGVTPVAEFDQVRQFVTDGPASRKPRTRAKFDEAFKEATGFIGRDLIENNIPEDVLNSTEFKEAIRKILDEVVDPEGAQFRLDQDAALKEAERKIREIRNFEIESIKEKTMLEEKSLRMSSEDLNVLKEELNLSQAIEKLRKAEENIVEGLSAKKLEELTHVRDLAIAEKDLAEQRLRNAEILASPVAAAIVDVDKRLEALMDTQKQIVELSKTIESSFSESFKGIIKGTMSVQDAFRNMFMRIADHFLDMAAQMMAAQISKGFLGLFSNLFNPIPLGNDVQGFGGQVFKAANGGPVGMRQPYLVGERGPELFVPNQSGNIIPNHDLAGIGGGGVNVVVNVDASGSSVEGDEDQGRELGRLISVAVQSEIIQQQRPGGLLA
jgi:hypothetical protein